MMANKANEASDLALAEKLVFDGCDLSLERFTQAETAAGPTPDYRLRNVEGAVVGFAEIKSPRDDWLDQQLEGTSGEVVGGLRNDPTFNRIERHIRKTARQFDAVSPQGRLPNILVFINHDDASSVADLIETVTGHFHASDGGKHPTMMRTAQRVSASAANIHLFVWINAKTQKRTYLFNQDAAKVQEVCKLLGIDPNRITSL